MDNVNETMTKYAVRMAISAELMAGDYLAAARAGDSDNREEYFSLSEEANDLARKWWDLA